MGARIASFERLVNVMYDPDAVYTGIAGHDVSNPERARVAVVVPLMVVRVGTEKLVVVPPAGGV